MARGFRYYGKKRGHRRTGSPALASLGEAAFFAVLLLLGVRGWCCCSPPWSCPSGASTTSSSRPPARCSTSRSARSRGEDGPLYRPEIKIEYEVGGVEYRDWHYDIHRGLFQRARERAGHPRPASNSLDQASTIAIPAGTIRPNPGVVVLVRGYRWWVWLVFTVPASFVVIGAGGLLYALLHWGKSAERRAAMTQRVQERDLFGGNGSGQRLYPFVPHGADMTNSPGTRLKFPPADGRLARLGAVRHAGLVRGRATASCRCWSSSPFAATWRASPTGFSTLFTVPLRADRPGSDRRLPPPTAGRPRASGQRWWKSPTIPCIPAGSTACSCRNRDG